MAPGEMRDEKRSMFRVHRVILSALSEEFRTIFMMHQGEDEGKENIKFTAGYRVGRGSMCFHKSKFFALHFTNTWINPDIYLHLFYTKEKLFMLQMMPAGFIE